ncbi:MAG: cohesin domain-containing protein, partial [Chloroflexi bacterium]|nr:cohesin domain-containing protein [Chloroflexota bacterium]
MKKSFLFILVLLLALCFLGWRVVSAATTIGFNPTDVEVQLGQEFYIDVVVNDIGGLYALEFDLKYNPTYLELTEITEGEFLSQGETATYWIDPSFQDQPPNRFAENVGITRLGVDEGVDGSGILARVHFRALTEISNTKVYLQNANLVDPNTEDITRTYTNSGECRIDIDINNAVYQPPGIPTPVDPHPAFTTNCDTIYGWCWLRDSGYAASATWALADLPPGEDITLLFNALVTNQVNGGSGYSTPVEITYASPDGGTSQFVDLYLQNPLTTQNPADSHGYGYVTTAYLPVPGAYIGASGGLTVTLQRKSPNQEHVAINQDTVKVVESEVLNFLLSMNPIDSGIIWMDDSGSTVWSRAGFNPHADTLLLFNAQINNPVTAVQPEIHIANNTYGTWYDHITLYPATTDGSLAYGTLLLPGDSFGSAGSLGVSLSWGQTSPRLGAYTDTV